MNPLLVASNALVYAINYPAYRTARVVLEEPGRALPPRAVFFAWHRFNYALTPALLAMPRDRRPTIIMHDGIASRALTHLSSEWLGLERFAFERRGATPPREQIAEYVRRSGCSIFLLPDAGGPYGVVKPGIVAIARACALPVVPVHVRCERALVLGRTLRHVIPLPTSTIHVRYGEPIAASDVTRDACQRALDACWETLGDPRTSCE